LRCEDDFANSAVKIKQKLEQHDLGKLLTTINGVGAQTAAYLIAELGDPARFHSAAALASYVGVAPRLRQSGKRRFSGTAVIRLGNARLRKAPSEPAPLVEKPIG